MKIAVCTSFSATGSKIYGNDFVETFQRYWPKDVDLYAVHEGLYPRHFKDSRTHFRHLLVEQNKHIKAFRKLIGERDRRAYRSGPRWGAAKWSRKVMALSHHVPDVDWWIWIDADVVTKAEVTNKWLRDLLRPDREVIYLGRPMYRYSETGFVAYQVGKERPRKLIETMREIYTSGEVFDFSEYGDGYVFDVARRRIYQNGDPSCFSLSSHLNIAGPGHVWPHTVLDKVMDHAKGPTRKNTVYGATC